MNRSEAVAFAHDWIAAWNAHDLDRIMAHYAEELDFCSPVIQQREISADGIIRAKPLLRDYFAGGLKSYPNLTFILEYVLVGVNSLVLHYHRSIDGLIASEYMELDSVGHVHRVRAHYSPAAH
jgi:hypothetical protein